MFEKNLFLLLFVLLIGGCSSLPETNVGEYTYRHNADHGLVVIQAVSNGVRLAGPLQNWDRLTLVNVDDDEVKEDDLMSLSALAVHDNSVIFVGSVPPGQYKLGALNAYLNTGDFHYSAWALITPIIGEFKVQQGRITDLGTLVYHPFEFMSRFDDELPDFALSRDPEASVLAQARLLKPKVFAKYAARESLSWDADAFDAQRNQALRQAQASPLLTGSHRVSDDLMVFTGKLGAVVSYDVKRGTVQSHKSPTWREITDFVAVDEAHWMIAGPLGLLMESRAPFERWQTVALDWPEARVAGLMSGGPGQVFVLLEFEEDKYFELHEYDALKKTFTPLLKLDRVVRFLSGVRPDPSVVFDTGVLRVFYDKKMYVRNLQADAEWHMEESDIVSLWPLGNGLLLGSDDGGMRNPVLYSADRGRSWHETVPKGIKYDEPQAPPFIFTDGTMISPRQYDKLRIFRKTKVFPVTPLQISTDHGATWQQIGEIAPTCFQLALAVSSDTRQFALCENSNVYMSEDRGAHWQWIIGQDRVPIEDFPQALVLRKPEKKKRVRRPPRPEDEY